MRSVLCICAVLISSVVTGQQRDAAEVLKDMRKALGGDEALDAVKTFSASGSRTLNTPVGTSRLGLEWFAIMPDHFLEVRRDSPPGPVSIEITYYSGVAGSRVLRKTESRGVSVPELTYADNSAAAVAAREQAVVLRAKQSLARLTIALFGISTASYPVQFSYVGVEQADRRSYDVIEATAAEGVLCRLHVDAATHLPAMLTWQDERPFVVTSSSIVTTTTRGGKVVSQSEPSPGQSSIPYRSQGMAPKRWVFSNFKVQDGINWPRRIEEGFEGKSEEIRLGFKINPRIDARKFDIK